MNQELLDVLADIADCVIYEPDVRIRDATRFARDEIKRLYLKVNAMETAMRNLLEHANPYTEEDYAEYETAARNAETVLRGGVPEGARKITGNLD